MPISSRLRTLTLCVAGALLVPCAAFAQTTTPSILPDDGTAPVPSPVTSVPTAPANTQPYIESLELKDISVADALSMISGQYKVPISIFGVTGKIDYLNLTNKTAQQAIETIVKAAKLSVEMEGDTYIISNAPAVVSDSTPLRGSSINQITPQNNIGSGFGNGLGSFTSPTAGVESSGDQEPKLSDIGTGKEAKKSTYRFILKNVKPTLMAYWLDPANHEAPTEIRVQSHLNGRYTAPQISSVPVGSSGGMATTLGTTPVGQMDTKGVVPGFNSTSSLSSTDTSLNPYIQSNSEKIQTLADAQFGGGIGGGGGGIGGGGGGRGGIGGGAGGRGGNQGVFQLPQNVDRIVAVDPQNALLVFGTPQGANELAQTINFLDRPLRQVEIEAQFVSVNVTDAKGFGIDFTTARGNFSASSTGGQPDAAPGDLQVGFIRGNFQAALRAFENNNRAKILTAPRVLAINNLTASLTQTINNPIVLSTTTTVVGNAAATNQGQSVSYIQTQIGLDVTPTINNDDTITVLMRPFFQDVSPAASATARTLGLQTVTAQELETIANVRDGETIALGGLRRKTVTFGTTKIPLLGDIPLVGGLFRSRNTLDNDTELIIFLKATIVRRAGDDDTAVPGTAIAGGG